MQKKVTKKASNDSGFDSSSSEEEVKKVNKVKKEKKPEPQANDGFSSDSSDHKVQAKLDIKELRAKYNKFLPSKDQMKKKNYIGDKFIVEKDDESEAEDKPEKATAKTGAYAQRMQKITQIYEDSTNEYNKF